jgi:hypothetical protein
VKVENFGKPGELPRISIDFATKNLLSINHRYPQPPVDETKGL